MIGKFLISQTFAIAYLYTAELFPTNVRNVAVGTASTFARIGSMSAPYIVDLLVSQTSKNLLNLTIDLTNMVLFPIGWGSSWNSCDHFWHFLDNCWSLCPDATWDTQQKASRECSWSWASSQEQGEKVTNSSTSMIIIYLCLWYRNLFHPLWKLNIWN